MSNNEASRFCDEFLFTGQHWLKQSRLSSMKFAFVCLTSLIRIFKTILLCIIKYITCHPIVQCVNMQDAYYECDWYEMPLNCKKCLLICMIRSQVMLYLTAGKFYIFSLNSFTDVSVFQRGIFFADKILKTKIKNIEN